MDKTAKTLRDEFVLAMLPALIDVCIQELRDDGDMNPATRFLDRMFEEPANFHEVALAAYGMADALLIARIVADKSDQTEIAEP